MKSQQKIRNEELIGYIEMKKDKMGTTIDDKTTYIYSFQKL